MVENNGTLQMRKTCKLFLIWKWDSQIVPGKTTPDNVHSI